MMNELTSTRQDNKVLTVDPTGKDDEVFVTILVDGTTSEQIRVDGKELRAALVPDEDPDLVKRLSKLAESWVFSNQDERKELLAAMNSFPLPFEYGAVIKGKKNSYDSRFLILSYVGENTWQVLGGHEVWTTIDVLSGLHELALVQPGFDYDTFRQLQFAGTTEEEK